MAHYITSSELLLKNQLWSAILYQLPVGRGVAIGSEKRVIFLLAFVPSFFSSFLLCW
jgi:hypothetical protein